MSWNFVGTIQSIYYTERRNLQYQRQAEPKTKNLRNEDLDYVIRTSPVISQSNRSPHSALEELEVSLSNSTEGSITL